jgi:hypothetical protein
LRKGRSNSTIQGGDFTYKGNGFQVSLQNEVLTVNGKRYAVPNKNDSIKVIDNYVEIGGRPATPSQEGTGEAH